MHEIPVRREFKYLLPPEHLPRLRDEIAANCTLDPYAGPDRTYGLRSLYFDSTDLRLYWANDREDAVRFKARVRTYPDAPGSPVFAEIKGRNGDAVRKTRAVLSADNWRIGIAGGDVGTRSGALDQFVIRFHRYHLRPMTLVQYRREAYISRDDVYARISIDTEIVCRRIHGLTLQPDGDWDPVDHPVRSITPGSICVVELKWAERTPAWMIRLVQRMELMRHSFSKYCYSMLTHGEAHFRDYRRASSPWS